MDIPYLRRVCLDGVVDVDEDQEEGDQHCHPARNHLWVDQETTGNVDACNVEYMS